ncbi:MAG: SOS response-associated peptidase [Thermoguttaceae bacterium]|jgi:putative SOS response-associated peptidase YedK|nr:SOS response-associated peptidase [Thermoguttaceae bacterium]
MCGRFTLRAPASVIAEHFDLPGELPPLAPRYNIAPTQPVPVVRLDSHATPLRREMAALHWGLIPHWAKDASIGSRMINARADTVAEKPAYKAALRRRRCLLPADGFYEWHSEGGRKQPYFFSLQGDGLFAFAGLWERWEGPDHTCIESCTLLTTEPNPLVRPIHNRMPVLLPQDAYDLWLDPAEQDPGRLLPLLCPYPAGPMRARAVSTVVNSPRNDSPDCIAPV